jgi:hypothetical protein
MRTVNGVYENGKVKLRGRAPVKGPVPVVVTFCDGDSNPSTAAERRSVSEHPSVGMWAGRRDIGDSVAFARALRAKAERRAGGR